MAKRKNNKQAPAAVAPTSPARAEVGGFEPHNGGHRCTAQGCGVVVSGPELREQLEAHRALHQG